MAPEGAMSVEGGNWKIFHKMVESSGAILALNTSVVALEFAEGSATSTSPQYAIRTASSTLSSGERYPVAFDNVIIAGPYQFSNIVAAENVIPDPIDEIPYVQLHVTIFSSPHRYSPQFFGLDGSTSIPGTILTTLSDASDPAAGDPGVGKAGFFSISILRYAINPKTGRKEYIYKIFSPNKITPEFLRFVYFLRILRFGSVVDFDRWIQ
jgi:prenylcysteine oxidase/farnesylcysteine lyase